MSKRFEKYFICNECAKEHGLIAFKTGNTLVGGLCGWCDSKEERVLTPLRDMKHRSENKRGDVVMIKKGEK